MSTRIEQTVANAEQALADAQSQHDAAAARVEKAKAACGAVPSAENWDEARAAEREMQSRADVVTACQKNAAATCVVRDLLTAASPLLAEIKAHAEQGRALVQRRQELARSFAGKLPPGVADSILAHHAIDYDAPVFGLALGEFPPDLAHQIKAHAQVHAGRHASHATKHGAQ
jgi:hypothetical protein